MKILVSWELLQKSVKCLSLEKGGDSKSVSSIGSDESEDQSGDDESDESESEESASSAYEESEKLVFFV